MRAPVAWKWLGRRVYDDALAQQTAAWETRRAGGPDVCLALEHPPTVTLGKRAGTGDLQVPEEILAARGIACARVERGGFATYHGPGQLVLYPIVALAPRGFGVGTFVAALEAIMIDLAGAFGVVARRDPRGRGIWTDRGKLGAVGIRVRDGVSTHGLALNVDVDLGPFEMIAPCGMPGVGVTSLAREGACASLGDVAVAAQAIACRHLASAAHGEHKPLSWKAAV
jgi:lipoate-protein ligase B